MSEQEYADLELARRYIFDSGESNLVKVYLAGLRAGREQERKRIIDKLKEIGFTNVDAALDAKETT